MKKVLTYLGGSIIAAIFIAGFIAYFISGWNPQTHQSSDGFGRVLVEAPWFMRLFFGQDKLWPGWAWFFGDMVIFWGGIALGAGLISLAERFGEKGEANVEPQA